MNITVLYIYICIDIISIQGGAGIVPKQTVWQGILLVIVIVNTSDLMINNGYAGRYSVGTEYLRTLFSFCFHIHIANRSDVWCPIDASEFLKVAGGVLALLVNCKDCSVATNRMSSKLVLWIITNHFAAPTVTELSGGDCFSISMSNKLMPVL